jgi:phosphoenolpyruvate carboxykinase (ATP)
MRKLVGGFVPKNVVQNPDLQILRELAKKDEITTEFGSPSYCSKVMNRSAKFTEIIYDEPSKEQKALIEAGLESIKERPMIELFRHIGNNASCTMGCRLLIPQDFARLAFFWGKLLFDNPDKTDDLITIAIPDWPERKVIVDAKNYITYVFGTDYAGEVKKSFLRMAMWYVKQKLDCLGLHAGSKVLKVKNQQGAITEKGAIFFGLSGTGKSTLTCHDHYLSKPEGVIIRQDDVIFLNRKGTCYGSENNFYIKTEGLEPTYQRVMYQAFTSQNASMDNVAVSKDGTVNLEDVSRTTNGRAVVCRKDMDDTDQSIDLPKVHMIFFITRREDIIPPIAKLTPLQAAAFFMLGESIETSAGDPEKAGQSKREVGTNPFIIGSKGKEGTLFYEMISGMKDVECFLLNTGKVGGSKGKKITVKDTAEIIKKAANESIQWEKDPFWGYQIPAVIQDFDLAPFQVGLYYSDQEIEEKNRTLYKERLAWLKQFPELSDDITKSLLTS